jgi:hypothetical protein
MIEFRDVSKTTNGIPQTINTFEAKHGAVTLRVFPLPRKGGFTVRSSELGLNWSAEFHARRLAEKFGWKVEVGATGLRANLIGQGEEDSVERAKQASLKCLIDWSTEVRRACTGRDD